MPFCENFCQAECDGCGYKENVESVKKALDNGWTQPKRVDFEGNEDRFVLCTRCSPKYKNFVRGEGQSFQAFIKGLRK